MSRTKNFSREEVLEKSIPVFWKKGFSNTCLQDIEKATGVNKSGLYSEFENKEDLYIESLRHYVETRGVREVLTKEPLGWGNIETFLKQIFVCMEGQKGCFSISTMRELPVLPAEANEIISKTVSFLKKTIAQNIANENPEADANALADIIVSFHTGLCLEQNLNYSKASINRKIENLLTALKKL
jgi:TetR/AcrR family transcriptional regulator, copper-responsive repressor